MASEAEADIFSGLEFFGGETMIYTVTLSNGKVFSGLRMSGTCFVSKSEVKAEDFSGGLKKVHVHAAGNSSEEAGLNETYELGYCELGGVFVVEGEYYFWLNEPDAAEVSRLKAEADIEYIAMMTGVEL